MKQSRRKFIEKAVLASLGIITYSHCKKQKPVVPNANSDIDIIVVGAGISGLVAADKLSKAGYHVTVLEASDRAGGRIQSVDFGGMKADLGASWIHGDEGNPLFSFAEGHQIDTIPTIVEPTYIYDIDGEEVSEEEWNRWTVFLNKLYDESFNFPEITLLELIEMFWEEEVLSPKLERVFHCGIRLELEIPYAEDANKLAANVLQHDGYYPGRNHTLPKGMISVIDALVPSLEIITNTFVANIDYAGDSVVLHTLSPAGLPTSRSCNACHSNAVAESVETTKVYKADRVLVALPVGVLKNENVRFTPPLPPEKKAAIQNIQMGLMNKVYMRFDHPFWPADGRFFSKQKTDYNHIFELMNMHIINQQPVLVAFFAGYHAKQIETMTEDALMNYLTEQLKDIFGEHAPAPVEILCTKWHQSRFSLGSYPVIPPGFDNSLFEKLATPVENKLFFAGDATEKIHYASAHGAYRSGLRAAKEIQDSL